VKSKPGRISPKPVNCFLLDQCATAGSHESFVSAISARIAPAADIDVEAIFAAP